MPNKLQVSNRDQQLSFLGLPSGVQDVKRVQFAQRSADGGEISRSDSETPKNNSSMLPILVGAAAVLFFMSKK